MGTWTKKVMIASTLAILATLTPRAALDRPAMAAANLTPDFDGDGYGDLAVGTPYEDLEGVSNAGAVNVIYGSMDGLTASDNQYVHQDVVDVEDQAESSDQFGQAITWGDFNGDGRADLAVGVPLEDVTGIADAGAVHVFYGSTSGLTMAGDQYFTQDTAGVAETSETGDRFGFALAAGDFEGDGYADLAIGAPYEEIGGTTQVGVVQILRGKSSGLTVSEDQIWYQGSGTGLAGMAEKSDRFGWSLAAANFGKTSHADLAVGVPLEDLGTISNAGAVNVIYGSSTGLAVANNQVWAQDSPGLVSGDGPEAEDLFGYDLAAANFGNGAEADLAVGAHGESDHGAVNVIYGSTSGLKSTYSQFWYQDSPGIIGDSEDGDFFGKTLSAADFGNSAEADLAVGVPGETHGSWAPQTVGAVNVIYGSSTGLTSTGTQYWSQDSSGMGAASEDADGFGSALFAANFGYVGSQADLAIGVPGEDTEHYAPIPTEWNLGGVHVLYGSASGLSSQKVDYWSQGGLGQGYEQEDKFGSVM